MSALLSAMDVSMLTRIVHFGKILYLGPHSSNRFAYEMKTCPAWKIRLKCQIWSRSLHLWLSLVYFCVTSMIVVNFGTSSFQLLKQFQDMSILKILMHISRRHIKDKSLRMWLSVFCFTKIFALGAPLKSSPHLEGWSAEIYYCHRSNTNMYAETFVIKRLVQKRLQSFYSTSSSSFYLISKLLWGLFSEI